MSDEKKLESVTIQVIKPNSLVNIQVSSSFHERLQELLQDQYSRATSEEAALKAVADLASRQPETPWEFHLVTIISLIYEVEQAAFKQGLTEDKKIDVPKHLVP
jgi:hypothetical protein